MTQTVSRTDFERQERNRLRFIQNELVDALRGSHPGTRIVPVVTEDIDEPEQKHKDGKVKFRIVGAYKGSKWSKADYAALVFSPNWADADGTAYKVMLSEPAFENVREQLMLTGLACGREHFSMSGRTPSTPGTKACDFCELLFRRAQVYQVEGDEWVRNRMSAPKEWVTIVETLLAAATVTKLKPSVN